jgi:pimeloyl-ACP methyl ester carboxylesterase
LVFAGCGSGAPSTQRKAAARSLDGCIPLAAGTRALTLRPPGGSRLDAALVGTGKTTFVLSDESDENLCSWRPLVRLLRAHGYSALLYDYESPAELPADALAGVAAARRAGAQRVVLMGASVGARGSIKAAAQRPPGVVAVVSLSAERTVASDRTDLVKAARRVTVPTLLVGARQDPFAGGDTRPLFAALRSPHKRELIVPGSDHGTALLTDSPARARVTAAILAFAAGRNT